MGEGDGVCVFMGPCNRISMVCNLKGWGDPSLVMCVCVCLWHLVKCVVRLWCGVVSGVGCVCGVCRVIVLCVCVCVLVCVCVCVSVWLCGVCVFVCVCVCVSLCVCV